MRLWRSVTCYGITNYEIEGGKSIKVRKNVRKSISQYKHKEQPQTQDLMKQTSTFLHHLHPNHASEELKHQSKLELHVMKVLAKGVASTDCRQKSTSPMSANRRTVQSYTARTRQSWLRPIFAYCG
jgi:hypothetical protein